MEARERGMVTSPERRFQKAVQRGDFKKALSKRRSQKCVFKEAFQKSVF
jgi:hypothetical protein